uniref:DDE-1 domain-containing protein n=1 Tax=Acrobeloides nanus TaxID=290746 RepID=A0A914E4S0_9BILA
MGDWVDEVWLKRNNPASPQESGLIYDSAKCHLTEMAKNATQSSAYIAVIPGGLTKELQPLDISVNRSFKCHLRQQWKNWLLNNAVHTFTPGGKMRHASLVEVYQWVIKAGKQ